MDLKMAAVVVFTHWMPLRTVIIVGALIRTQTTDANYEIVDWTSAFF